MEPAGRSRFLPEADSSGRSPSLRGPYGRLQRHQFPRPFLSEPRVIAECVAKLGKWIVSCHAKDLAWIPEYNVHFKEVVPGKGQMDYETYLGELSKLPV